MRAVFDRYPLNSPWIRSLLSRYWLPFWFAANSVVAILYSASDTTLLYFDARLYIEAAKAWVSGGDPWAVQLAGNYFAAPPPSLAPLAPFAFLPTDVGVALLAGLVILGAVATVRMLRLPWWWILFPPLVQCMLSANVQSLLIPLVLLRAGPLAAFLKIYAAVPLVFLGRWRALVVVIVFLVISIPVLPWATFFAESDVITQRLAGQTRFALPTPLLIAATPIALVATWVVGRERAAWLVVPALWPSQQYYYGSLAMGARSGLAAALVALPVPGSGLIALIVLAAIEWRGGRRPTQPRSLVPDALGPSVR